MSELEIPERAYGAGEHAALQEDLRIASFRLQLDTAIEAAAPIIVAAELRRIAAQYGEREDVGAGDHVKLNARADELDPQ